MPDRNITEGSHSYVLKLMLCNANSYYEGSKLSIATDGLQINTGDSWFFLALLSLEIYLKALYAYHFKLLPKRRHELETIYSALPEKAKHEILSGLNLILNSEHEQGNDTNIDELIEN